MRYGEVVSVFSSVGKYPFMLAVIAGVPGNGDLLSISDLGFNQAVVPALTKAQAGGWRIEWRDHHRWKEDEVNAAEKRVDLLHLDTDRCACGIVAVDLCPDNPAAIEVAGDCATGITQTHEVLRQADGATRVVGGAYDDRFVRIGGGWRYAERRFRIVAQHPEGS